LDTLREVASKFKQYSFGYVPYEGNEDLLEEFEFPKKLPQSIVRYSFNNNEDDLFFEPPNPFTVHSISNWIENIEKGLIKPQSNSPHETNSIDDKQSNKNNHEDL